MRSLWVVLMLCLSSPTWGAVDPANFSTTYNCAEQQQADGTWVTCDGLDSAGGWTTTAGAKEQITTAANYASGAGGRGQRHWIGNGTNNNSGSIKYAFTARAEHYYMRWWVRWESGFQLGSSGQKLLYWNNDGGSNHCQGHTSGCYMLIRNTNIMLHVGGGPDVGFGAGNYQNSVSGWGYQDLMGGAGSDGAWHCMQIEADTNAAGTGVIRWWIDDTLRLEYTNVSYGSPYSGFGGFYFPENAVAVTVGGNDMYNDLDDVEISTTSLPSCTIGGGGGSAPRFSPAFLRRVSQEVEP